MKVVDLVVSPLLQQEILELMAAASAVVFRNVSRSPACVSATAGTSGMAGLRWALGRGKSAA